MWARIIIGTAIFAATSCIIAYIRRLEDKIIDEMDDDYDDESDSDADIRI